MADVIKINLPAMDGRLDELDAIEQELQEIVAEIDRLPFREDTIESKGPHAAGMKAFQTALRGIAVLQASLVSVTAEHMKKCRDAFFDADNSGQVRM